MPIRIHFKDEKKAIIRFSNHTEEMFLKQRLAQIRDATPGIKIIVTNQDRSNVLSIKPKTMVIKKDQLQVNEKEEMRLDPAVLQPIDIRPELKKKEGA